jgi:hypothetical protein
VPVQDVVIGDYLSLTGNTLDVAGAGQTPFIVQNLSTARKGRLAQDYLPQAQELSSLPSGYMKSEEGTGVVSTLTKIPAADIEGGGAGGSHAASHEPGGSDPVTRLSLTSTAEMPVILEIGSEQGPPNIRKWQVTSEYEITFTPIDDAGFVTGPASLRIGHNGDVYAQNVNADHHFYTGGYMYAAGGLDMTPLAANMLVSGKVPDARLSSCVPRNVRATPTFGTDQTAWTFPELGTAYQVIANVTAACGLHGIVAQADGYTFVLTNSSANDVMVLNQSASAVPANRIICPGGSGITLSLYKSVTLVYDVVLQRWRITNKAL